MTSKSERFFTWVWRANGLLILIAIVVCLVGLLILVADISGVGRDNPNRGQLANVAGTNIDDDNLELGGFRRIEDTDFMYATLAPSSTKLGSGSGRGNARNWLFFDITSRKANWLFADSTEEIVDHQFLYQYLDDDPSEREKTTVGIVMLLAEDRDTEESPRTRRMILVSPDGKSSDVLAEQVERLRDYIYVGATSQLIFYSTQGSIRVMDLNPTTATVVSDTLLSAGQ